MSEFDEKYNKIIEDVEKNIKDEKELEFVKDKINEMSTIFINMFDRMSKNSEKRIEDLEKNQKELEQKLNKVQNFVEDLKKDIYEEYNEEDYEFEVICPYCNNLFTTSNIQTEENEEIECPECHNIIELDWNEEESCTGDCSSCQGCSGAEDDNEIELEEDDEDDEDM